MTYTLNRKGTALNTGMCGAEGETRLFYEVKATAENCILDENGFMIPHEKIGDRVESVLKSVKSCELGAIQSLQECAGLLQSYDLPVDFLSVTVGMVNGKAHFTISDEFLTKTPTSRIFEPPVTANDHPITP